MRRRSRWPEFVVIVGLCFLTGMLLVANWTGLGSQDDPLGETRTPSRVFEGVVVADGQPLADVELELREEREPVASAVSDAQGRYSILWKPRTTLDADKLLLRALHPKHAIRVPSGDQLA